ncbi:anaphase-promoting complex subunit Cdc27p [Diutina catenulata]
MQAPAPGEGQYVIQHLRSVVIHSLDNFNYANAEFAGERLVALDPANVDSIYLYGLSMVRQNKFKSAYARLLEFVSAPEAPHLGATYLFARCCLELEKYTEGIFQLTRVDYLYKDPTKTLSVHQKHEYENHRSVYPDSSSVYHLLGDLYRLVRDTKNAAVAYSQALRHNKFDFVALEQLCRIGVEVKTKAVYEGTPDLLSLEFMAPNPDDSVVSDVYSPPRADGRGERRDLSSRDYGMNERHDFTKPRSRVSSAARTGATTPGNTSVLAQSSAGNTSLLPSSVAAPTPAPVYNFSKKPASARPPATDMFVGKEIDKAEKKLSDLYQVFARAYKAFCSYNCYKAIRLLESLPSRDKHTPWVVAKLGRLHYEIVNYKQSEYYFAKLRAMDRTRLEDMEWYSTLLWHLQKKAELTYLANELHDLDARSPVTWCAIGNLFSLNREPDEAIKAFSKASSLDRSFTYAYTLKGHEYFSNDNYEMAFESFRLALLLDARHYNALYGIGMVYMNLGDYAKADFHFRKAVAINPINIILICCVGMVLDKLGKRNLALRQYDLACKLQPLNPLPLFKKAQLLFSLQQFGPALKLFEQVKEVAPEEASVHFLLGQLYNIQNDKFSAIREFTIALNLDPKGNYIIKEAMESLKD